MDMCWPKENCTMPHRYPGAFIVATNGSWGIDNGMAADAPLWCAMYDSLGQAGILNVTAADNNPKHNVDSVGDLPSVCPSPI